MTIASQAEGFINDGLNCSSTSAFVLSAAGGKTGLLSSVNKPSLRYYSRAFGTTSRCASCGEADRSERNSGFMEASWPGDRIHAW